MKKTNKLLNKLLLALLLFLPFQINAENIKIPNEICSKHFDKVIEDGWSDENVTLNGFIIKSGTRAIPKILTNLKKPLVLKDDSTVVYKIPKILVNRDDYKQLFAYVKYLEHENRIDEADKIYVDALDGLNNIESEQIISLIFRIVLEKIVMRSIRESQARYGLNQELKDELKKSLIIDNQFLLEVIKKENSFFDSILKSFPKIRKNKEELYIHLLSAIETDSLNEYKSYKKKRRDELRTFGNMMKYTFKLGKLKLYKLLDIEADSSDIYKFKLNNGVYSATPRVLKTYQEYLTQVKNNKNFLESLEEKDEK